MPRVGIVTDSNSGITQSEAKQLGLTVVPMPFYIDGELFYEDINLTQEEFYHKLEHDAEISTSMPAVQDTLDLWNRLLKEYEQIVYIPMSSGLSSSCATASMLAEDFDGRVRVVNNQRISVTQRQSALDAMTLAERGWNAQQIGAYLEQTKFDSPIYITLDTLKYLKKGGRITPAAAALGTLLRLRPVLQIQGEKLDAFAKCRTIKAAKTTMLDAIRSDLENRFHMADRPEDTWIAMAYTKDTEAAELWKSEVAQAFPKNELYMAPLSLSISCHIGPGAIAVTTTKKLPDDVVPPQV